MHTIAIVGAGPASVYILKHLSNSEQRLSITIFEAGATSGPGLPYSAEFNSPDLLSNIPSVEIPPVTTGLMEWMTNASDETLARYTILRTMISDRESYPRMLIGEFYAQQFRNLVKLMQDRGHKIEVLQHTQVEDIKPLATGFEIVLNSLDPVPGRRADTVVLATGHGRTLGKEKRYRRIFRSPYPVGNLRLTADKSAVILGSSLSAIDAVVTLAMRYGRFEEDGSRLSYIPAKGSAIKLTMASRKGLLPDADFYYPIPEERMSIFNKESVLALINGLGRGLLNRATRLFKKQLVKDDPQFYATLAIRRFKPRTFSDAYFAFRQANSDFWSVAASLDEAKKNYARKHTLEWRYTLMRSYEVFALIVPYLDRQELAEFHLYLKGVFADVYGCVPHLSIERIVALHRAGCLHLVALGSREVQFRGGRFQIDSGGFAGTGEVLIDARGQIQRTIREVGFNMLANASMSKGASKVSEEVHEQYRLRLAPRYCRSIFTLSLPLALERFPFAQGLVQVDASAAVIAQAIKADAERYSVENLAPALN